MNINFAFSILFLVIVENVYGFAKYNWIPLKTGDKLPEDLFKIHEGKYIGRARHFDEILPAEIYPNGTGFISSCHKIIPKEEFEILSTREPCEYKPFSYISDIDETAVHVGTDWDGEPIYLGVSISDDSKAYHVASIFLTNYKIYTWFGATHYDSYQGLHFLSCPKFIETKWIDSSAKQLPNKTVSGGESEINYYEMYVARLKRYCEVVTGQIIPEMGISTAYLNDGTAIEAANCQVLLGEPGEYKWVSAKNGQIPDFAVVNGRYRNEMQYIARFNNSIGHLTHSEAKREEFDYDILVANP